MTREQKRAWFNIGIWGIFLLACLVLFISRGTILFWQDEPMKTTFYVLCGLVFLSWFTMTALINLKRVEGEVAADERDIEIDKKAMAVAGPISMIFVGVTCLVLMIIYLKGKDSTISPYYLLLIAVFNPAVYWISKAIASLVMYARE